MIRALHSVHTYLSLSENWIYPQIVRVPGVEGHVVCGALANQQSFPIDAGALALDPPPWNHWLGVPRVLDEISRLGGLGTAERIRKWHPHIMHAHFGGRGWSSLALKEQLKIPIVTSFYGYDAWTVDLRLWRRRYDALFARGDAFLVEGSAMRRRLEELGCSPDVVHVQRIGVDLTALPYQRRHFGDGLNVVMVGRFVEKKGLGDGLRACALAISGGARIAVTVVGDPAPDDAAGWKIKSELQSLAKGPELSGRVRFTGFLSMAQTRATLAAHNLLLCPSRRAANGDAEGGSPVVLTEAMAMGLLCIGTSHCDIPEVILEGKTGFVCKERDCTAMADVLCSLSANQDRIVGMTESGRRHVEEHFSLDVQLTKLAGIYQSLVAGAAAVPRVAIAPPDVVRAR